MKEDGFWINPYYFCNCEHQCRCSDGMHSYAKPYANLLSIVKPKLVFEWGPGKNTSIAIASGAKVVAIEQNPRWIPNIPKDFTCRNLPVLDDRYISIKGCETADVFFVDSRRRAECVESVYQFANNKAIVCLHDAQRSRYHSALRLFPFVRFLNQGFCVATRDRFIGKLIRDLK